MLEKSLEFYQEALYLREQSLGSKHLFTAELHQKIGKLYEQGGAYNEALRHYKKALWMRKELSYVENNLLIAESYNNLAVLYYYMQQYAIAKSYIDKTVNIRKKLLAPDNELLMNSYYNQKFIYKECQSKRDYLSFCFKYLYENIAAFFRRFSYKKEF
ncbi:tetratricopeptide repeat protein [bacterium]|nr:tetratricopeptide repeat protein [bacterium]MBU1959425.1 tetratricopeptide repeat protein [bacterium]